jgi:hypothetical protein
MQQRSKKFSRRVKAERPGLWSSLKKAMKLEYELFHIPCLKLLSVEHFCMTWLSKRLRRLEADVSTNDFSVYSSSYEKRRLETFSSEGDEHFFRHIDIVFGLSFIIIGGIVIYQLCQSYSASESSRGRKVISLFNYLICFTCLLHGLFFLLPNSYLYKYYLFNAIDCFQNNFHNLFINSDSSSFSSFISAFLEVGFSSSSLKGDDFFKSSSIWKGKFASEILLQFGNLSFI